MISKRNPIRPLAAGDALTLTASDDAPDSISVFGVVISASRGRVVLDLDCIPPFQSGRSFEIHNARAVTLTVTGTNGLRSYSGRLRRRGGQTIFTESQAAVAIQRRRDFRLDLARKVGFARGPAPQAKLRVRLVNLSGGGAQIELPAPLHINELVRLSAPMGQAGDEEWIDAVVLACTGGSSEQLRWIVRLSFDDDLGRVSLPELQRDEIVRYLFARQREMLRLRALLNRSSVQKGTRKRGLPALFARLRGNS